MEKITWLLNLTLSRRSAPARAQLKRLLDIATKEKTMSLQMRLNSAYICVKNMERAIDFYESLFEQSVNKKDKVFSFFDIHGFRLCLFNNQKVDEDVTYGDNCLLSIEVNDINKLLEKLKEINASIVFPLY